MGCQASKRVPDRVSRSQRLDEATLPKPEFERSVGDKEATTAIASALSKADGQSTPSMTPESGSTSPPVEAKEADGGVVGTDPAATAADQPEEKGATDTLNVSSTPPVAEIDAALGMEAEPDTDDHGGNLLDGALTPGIGSPTGSGDGLPPPPKTSQVSVGVDSDAGQEADAQQAAVGTEAEPASSEQAAIVGAEADESAVPDAASESLEPPTAASEGDEFAVEDPPEAGDGAAREASADAHSAPSTPHDHAVPNSASPVPNTATPVPNSATPLSEPPSGSHPSAAAHTEAATSRPPPINIACTGSGTNFGLLSPGSANSTGSLPHGGLNPPIRQPSAVSQMVKERLAAFEASSDVGAAEGAPPRLPSNTRSSALEALLRADEEARSAALQRPPPPTTSTALEANTAASPPAADTPSVVSEPTPPVPAGIRKVTPTSLEPRGFPRQLSPVQFRPKSAVGSSAASPTLPSSPGRHWSSPSARRPSELLDSPGLWTPPSIHQADRSLGWVTYDEEKSTYDAIMDPDADLADIAWTVICIQRHVRGWLARTKLEAEVAEAARTQWITYYVARGEYSKARELGWEGGEDEARKQENCLIM